MPSSPNNLADSAALDVDGAPPTSTITAAAYNDTANTITLTGTNFDTIDGGSGGADIKAQLDWTKFTWILMVIAQLLAAHLLLVILIQLL